MRSIRSLRECYVDPHPSGESMTVYWIFDGVPNPRELEALDQVEKSAMAEQPRKGFTFVTKVLGKGRELVEVLPVGTMRAWVRPGYRG